LNIFCLGLEARIIIQDITQTNKLKPISKCAQAYQTVVGESVGWAEVGCWWWRQKWVGTSKTLTDITTLAVKIKNRDIQHVWILESMEFAKILLMHWTEVPLINIQAQYRVFRDRRVEETFSLSLNEVTELDSKELIRTFMMKPNLYRNIEMVMQEICVGCIKLSVAECCRINDIEI
jgi:hypothetical protein